MYVLQIPYPRPATPPQDWLTYAATAAVESDFTAAIVSAVGKYRVAEGPKLDVRNVPQPLFDWVYQVLDPIVAQVSVPPVYEEEQRFRVATAPELDVRNVRQPSFDWLPYVVSSHIADTTTAPVMDAVGRYRTEEGPTLDVRSVQAPLFDWVAYVAGQHVASDNWPAIADAVGKYRTREGLVLDVRTVTQPWYNSRAFAQIPSVRTTQIIVEVVVRPHPPQQPIVPPPPLVFIGSVLHSITGPALPMEVQSGYVGQPPIQSQLQQVRAHYTETLAPRSSTLHPVHARQIGRTETEGTRAVLSPKNSWFHMRQTDRYHRVVLRTEGEAEVTGLTWMLREAGIR